MTFEDLEQARTARAVKDAKKEASSKARKAKQAKDASGTASGAKDGGSKKEKWRGKHMSRLEEQSAETETNMVQVTATEAGENDVASTSWQAPVAKMW